MGRMNQPRNDRDEADHHEAVARAAFDIYTLNGSQGGNDMGNWLDAERKVIATRYDEGYSYSKRHHGWLAMVPVMTTNDVPHDRTS